MCHDELSQCPVCQREPQDAMMIRSAVPYENGTVLGNRTHKDDAIRFRCNSCGEFVVTTCDWTNLMSPRLRQWNAMHLSALLREQAITRGLPPFWLRFGMDPYGELDWDGRLAPIDLDELLQRWPRTLSDRIDRTLCNLANLSKYVGDKLIIRHDDVSVTFSECQEESDFVMSLLANRDFVKLIKSSDGAEMRLDWMGWSRVEEFTRKNSSPQEPVFVAMWFGGSDLRQEMKSLYSDAIKPAVEYAGYRVTRIDFEEHNDWIMDQVLGRIR